MKTPDRISLDYTNHLDTVSAFSAVAGKDRGWLSQAGLAIALAQRGHPVDRSTVSRFASSGWAKGQDLAGLTEFYIESVFATTSWIAVRAGMGERILRMTSAHHRELLSDALEAAAETAKDLRKHQAELRSPKDDQERAERILDEAAVLSLEGQIARHREDFPRAHERFMKAATHIAEEAKLSGSDGPRILLVRSQSNAYDAGYRADRKALSQALGEDENSVRVNPYRGLTGAALKPMMCREILDLTISTATLLRDPRPLFNVSEGFLNRGHYAPEAAPPQQTKAMLFKHGGRALYTAWRIDPSPTPAPSVATYELPLFGAPYKDPFWEPVLEVAKELEAKASAHTEAVKE
jgi:hypothetical protein